jgi:hypothetical protein
MPPSCLPRTPVPGIPRNGVTPDGTLRMKPQNRLVNLPLVARL